MPAGVGVMGQGLRPAGNRDDRSESEGRGLGLGGSESRIQARVGKGTWFRFRVGRGSWFRSRVERGSWFGPMIDAEPGVRVPDLEVCDWLRR